MIIGFTGCKGVGKDTAAAFLVEGFDFHRVAFADKLKEAVANLFDITIEHVDKFKAEYADGIPYCEVTISQTDRPVEWRYTWREFLQRFGTEMGRRTFGSDFWVQQWEETLYRENIKDDNVVATDVRFQNEVECIQRMNGHIVEIVREGYEPDGHELEEPLPRMLIDAQITNNGSLNDLKVDVYDLYKELTR